MPNEPRRHHFVPRFCLAHFADANGEVWTYDAFADAPRPSAPEATGFEKDFHAQTREDGTRDQTLEGLFADLEGAAAPLYARLAEGEVLSNDDRSTMSEFFGIAHARSKRVRRSYGVGYGHMIQQIMRVTAQHPGAFAAHLHDFEQEAGIALTDVEREELRLSFCDTSSMMLSVDREFTLQALNLAPTVARIIHQMEWSIFTATDGEFILSDSPLVLYGKASHGGSGLGFADPGAYVTLPLTPKKMWMGHWREDMPQACAINAENVGFFNRLRAAHTDQFLYASYCDDELMALCKEVVKPTNMIRVGDPNTAARVSIRRKT